MADPNTRQGKRTPVTLKIKFKSETLEQFIERYAVDVSQGGIFIRTKEPLAVGTQMRFEFQLRDATLLIGGEGTVVWTRENDPSRPAIAPGMGVRFDRLAEGSQAVLERILAEKAKQAPQRAGNVSTKPPLFTDTPTKVAPAPVAEQLMAAELTPLPKPMPFHSDADEFPEEAFEEATKVRALDDLIAKTADDDSHDNPLADELAARRAQLEDATMHDPLASAALAAATRPTPVPETLDPASTSPGFARGAVADRDSAPGLPNPPEVHSRSPGYAPPSSGYAPSTGEPPPRMLDTSPSPRSERTTDAPDPMERLAKTKIGLEPVPAARMAATGPQPALRNTPPPTPSAAMSAAAPARPAIHEATTPVRIPAKKSAVPMVILLLLLLAGGGAALWIFVLRDQFAEPGSGGTKPGSGSDVVAKNGSGSAGSANSTNNGGSATGSDEVPPKNGSAEPAGSGSGSGSAGSGAPATELVATEIAASVPGAQVEIVGTPHKGPAPLSAQLEKDKPYKVRVSAPGFATLEQDVKGGTAKTVAKLDPKPRIIMVDSDPRGALILLDGAAIGHATPFEVKLSAAQAARKSVRISLIKNGFQSATKVIPTEGFTEEAARMVTTFEAKLAVQVVVRPPPGGGSGSGSGGGSGSGEPVGSGSNTGEPPPGGGSGSAPPPPPPPPTGGSGKEPEPDFVKP